MINKQGENQGVEELQKKENKIEDNLNGLKEKIEALKEMPGKKVYEMAAKMSSTVWEMANKLPEGDPDRKEALAAISGMIDSVFSLKEEDNRIETPKDTFV